jgi:hypothetical protein
MKKLLFAIMAIPLFAAAQQEKNVISSVRLLPKYDKIVEFETALANHNKKFHATEWKATVFSVESGPDAGSYQYILGPASWEDIDKRIPSAEHDLDWNKNVMSLVQKSFDNAYLSYNKDLSTVAVGDFVDKVTISRWYYKVGEANKMETVVNRLKKVWEAEKQSVAVYRTNSSGEGAFLLVNRHKNGWTEKGTPPSKPFRDNLGGNAEFDEWLSDLKACMDHAISEMISRRKDLSSN